MRLFATLFKTRDDPERHPARKLNIGGHDDLQPAARVGRFLEGHQALTVRPQQGRFDLGGKRLSADVGGPHPEFGGYALTHGRGPGDDQPQMLGRQVQQLAAMLEIAADRDQNQHGRDQADGPVRRPAKSPPCRPNRRGKRLARHIDPPGRPMEPMVLSPSVVVELGAFDQHGRQIGRGGDQDNHRPARQVR